MGGHKDGAGECRGPVQAEHEAHLIGEIAGQAGGCHEPEILAAKAGSVPRQTQHSQGEEHHRRKPDGREGHRIDVPPGHLEQRERGGPHQDHRQQGNVDRRRFPARPLRAHAHTTMNVNRSLRVKTSPGPTRRGPSFGPDEPPGRYSEKLRELPPTH
jgi:hypothetical protein